MSLILNPASMRQFEHLITRLPQALLVVGEKGMGARTIARELAHTHAKSVQQVAPEKDKKPDRAGSIGVEQIRELYASARSRETASRVIVIEDAHTMTPQAQNAFLKLLEEPSANTHFILSAHTRQGLLATILSRVQTFELRPITPEQTNELLDELKVSDARSRAQLVFVASGNPAELIRLATEPRALTERGGVISDARAFLQAAPYEQLTMCQKYKDDRAKALRFVDACLDLLKASLTKQPSNQQIIRELERHLRAYEQIQHNGNIRLNLAGLVL